MNRVQLKIQVDPLERRALKVKAAQEGTTVTEIVRQALAPHLAPDELGYHATSSATLANGPRPLAPRAEGARDARRAR
jgi:hypothetical protein